MTTRRVGVALGDTWITAVEELQSRGGIRLKVHRRSVESYECLGDVLGELRARTNAMVGGVALFEPLAHTKRVTLPPIARRSANRLAQTEGREFLPWSETELENATTLAMSTAGETGSSRVFIIAGCGNENLTRIEAAVAQPGITVPSIMPAPFAIAMAARMLVRVRRRAITIVIGERDACVELIAARRGSVIETRSVPTCRCSRWSGAPAGNGDSVLGAAGWAAEELKYLQGSLGPAVVLEACRPAADTWEQNEFGVTPLRRDAGLVPFTEVLTCSPMTVDTCAALGALRAEKPRLASHEMRLRDRGVERRRATTLGTLAFALGLAASGLSTIGNLRAESILQHRRAQLRSALEIADEVQATATGIEARRRLLEALMQPREPWSERLLSLLNDLPEDVSLRSLSAGVNSAEIRGVAPSAEALALALGERVVKVRHEEPDGRPAPSGSMVAEVSWTPVK
jgi:hypothetical protein